MENHWTIHLVLICEGRNQNHLQFFCYLPSAVFESIFEYSGTDIVGCVDNEYYLFDALKEELNRDFGFPLF